MNTETKKHEILKETLEGRRETGKQGLGEEKARRNSNSTASKSLEGFGGLWNKNYIPMYSTRAQNVRKLGFKRKKVRNLANSVSAGDK